MREREQHSEAAPLLSMPMSEAKRLHVASLAGDAEAKAFFDTLFTPGAPCWLCDEPCGEAPFVAILPDACNECDAILAPECPSCRALPKSERRRRQLGMLRKMWPRMRWRLKRDNDPGYLRGGRPKLRNGAKRRPAG